MSVFEWARTQGYECIKGDRIRLGGKRPDIVAFSDEEMVTFERKKHTNELTTALGQCLHYLLEANKAFIVLPEKEIKNVPKKSLTVLEKNGVGLLVDGKDIRIVVEAKKKDIPVEELIEKLKQKLLERSATERKITEDKKRIKENKEKIVAILKQHPEGLMMKEIAEKIGMHRINIAKYIYALVAAGKIRERIAGSAKLYYLAKKEGEK